MSRLQIIGLGLTTIDILIRTEKMPTWENGGRLCDLSMDGGGPVGTGLVAAARLGAQVGFVGTCGCDEAGKFLLALLTRDGIDVSRVVRRNLPEQQMVLVYVHEQTGERIFGFREHMDQARLSPEELDRDYITAADYLHVDGTHFDAAVQAARWMHEAGKPVLFDAARSDGMDENTRARMRALVEVTDYLVCGSGFSQALSGKEGHWAAQEEMLKRGPRVVVQTEGEQGSYTLTADDRFHTPIFPVDVLDTTGAGDVFHGAYLVGLLKGWDLRKTAQFATAVSALKCTRLGGRVGTPYYAEVIAFLKARGIEME
jgi:sulfofructose kinase